MPRKPGPAPKYCSHAHRQQAYELRRGSTRHEDLTHEVTALRARVRRLEYDNHQLRQELTESAADVGRLYRELHPLRPGLVGLTGTPADQPPPPETPRRGRRRTSKT